MFAARRLVRESTCSKRFVVEAVPANVQETCRSINVMLGCQVNPGKNACRLATIISIAIAARIMPMSRWVIAVILGDR